jgi:hypothetical protein
MAAFGCSDDAAEPADGLDPGAEALDAGSEVEVGDTPDEALEPGVPPIDILVLVDNTGSMAQDQQALTQRFPDLLEELVHPTDRDGDGAVDHRAVTDIHLGVVTPDVGAGGWTLGSGCDDEPSVGDDGCLHHDGTTVLGTCSPTFPTWLTWRSVDEATYAVRDLADDFTCIAMIDDGGASPTLGCGIEQPLESLRRALTTQQAAGGCNEGFLRPDSLLVLIVLTDEDDASIDPAHYDMLDPDRTGELGHVNVRTFLHPEMLIPVEEFVEAFRALRPAGSGRLVVGMLVGVPPDRRECSGDGDELGDCLGQPEMEERVDPATPSQLVASCNTSMGLAMPPVRLVQLAQQLGKDAYVGSQCETDWGDTIRGITDAVVERLPSE